EPNWLELAGGAPDSVRQGARVTPSSQQSHRYGSALEICTKKATRSEIVGLGLGFDPAPQGEAVTESAMVLYQEGVLAVSFKQTAQAVDQLFDHCLAMVLLGPLLQGSLNGRNGFPSDQVVGVDTPVCHQDT